MGFNSAFKGLNSSLLFFLIDKILVWRNRHKRYVSIKVEFLGKKKNWSQSEEWIHLALDRYQWLSLLL